MTDYYKAGVEALDFASPKALKRINGWCSDRTHGMIPSIIDQTNPQDVSYLMNAIYFNGSWTDKFDKRETKVEPFRGYTRDIKRVNMMHRNDKYFFANSQDFDAVQIPYGDRSFQMMVLLPHEGKSIVDMMSTLTSAKLDQVRQSMDECPVDLKLPDSPPRWSSHSTRSSARWAHRPSSPQEPTSAIWPTAISSSRKCFKRPR